MTPQETQLTDNDSTAAPPKKHFPFARLLLIVIILAGIAGGYFVYTYQLHHQHRQQTDQALQQTLAALKDDVSKNESSLSSMRDEQSKMADALQKIQNTPPPVVSSPAPNPAISAAYKALSALDAELDTLPMQQPATHSTAATPSEPETNASWHDRLLQMLQSVWHQLVTIRHTGDKIGIMTPARKQLVLLSLHSNLDAAKWAVLHHDAAVYKIALANARHTLGHYFSEDTIRPLVERLDALENAGIPENTAVTPAAH